MNDLASLGINDANELFWNGRRVEIRRRLDLTRFQNALAVAVAMATILGAVGSLAQGVISVVDHLQAAPPTVRAQGASAREAGSPP